MNTGRVWHLKKSPRQGKKWRVVEESTDAFVDFGAKGYSDYTLHKDPDRMNRYTKRHRSRETWSYDGRYTAGFWAKHLLWNKPSLLKSAADLKHKFGIQLVIPRTKTH